MRRQAKLDKEDYLIFAGDLEKYELADIEAGINALPPKRDGQTAFPDVDTILEAVRGVIRARKAVEDDPGRKWSKYVEQCQSEAIFEPDAEALDLISRLNEKFGLERPREIETKHFILCCPKCSFEMPVAGNIRCWTSDELRAHAATLDEMHKMAMANTGAGE